MELGTFGVWWSGSWRTPDESIDVPAALEQLGYGALWSSGGFDPGLSGRFERLLSSTEHVTVASGIVSIWASEPADVARAVHDLDTRFPGRFLLGLGASHAPIVEGYSKPYSRMVAYLDELDAAEPTVPPERRILAALGPRMLELSAARSVGAHPYFVPAEHAARGRDELGTGPLLAPEATVVLESDPGAARELARSFTTGYLSLPNYANNLATLGFDQDDLAGGGSDKLVDAVVCWGDTGTVATKLRRYLEAGADHVCVQVVTGNRDGFPLDAYRELAEALFDR